MADPQGTGGLLITDAPPLATPAGPAVTTARPPRSVARWATVIVLATAMICAWTVSSRRSAKRPSPTTMVRVSPVSGSRTASPAGLDGAVPFDGPLADAGAMARGAAEQAGTFDADLLAAYARFAGGDADGAIAAARSLTEATPSSGLAQIVYADLLRLRLGAPPVSGWGASAPAPATTPSPTGRRPGVDAVATAMLLPGSEVSHQTRLDDLLAEARARIAAAQSTPPRGTLPSQFVQLSPGVGHAIAVDVARSRVYALVSGPDGWAVERDYYASVGKLGSDKHAEGDLRTPIGVYFVTGTVAKGRMADRFGSSALTLNYPNQYDQLRARTGNGIWLHGVPASLYARAPLATDGCVALSNDDMTDLARHVDRQQTPILIAPTLDWVVAGRPDQAGNTFLAAFARWREAHASIDPDTEMGFYSTSLRTPAAASGPSWSALLQSERHGGHTAWAPVLSDVSVVGWRDDRAVMVVTFRERDGAGSQPRLRRQYWVEDDRSWHIIYEGDVG